MSIISTTIVPDGIVMATDSRSTGFYEYQNGIKKMFAKSDNEQKLFLIKNNIGISFCGECITDGKLTSKFIQEFDKNEVTDCDTAEDVANKLVKYSKGSHYNVCGYINNEPYVFCVDDDRYVRINANGDTYRFIYEGQKDAITNLYHSDNSAAIKFSTMNLKDAIDFTAFNIELTIKYQYFTSGFQSCGGPIDVLLLTSDSAKFIKHKILYP